jgi:hypothetical protein
MSETTAIRIDARLSATDAPEPTFALTKTAAML